MSDFHSLFRESLDKRKLTIYRLSKELQIDRSTLYQVQNGGRLPTAQVFRRMASYLNLSSREEKQWLEAWKRERLGPNHYYLRRKVEVCVRMLDKYTYERTAADEPFVWEEQITQTVCAEGKSKAAILLKKLLRAYLLSGDLAILDVHLPLPFFSRCCTGIPWMAGKRSGICVRQLLPLKGQEQEDAVPALEALDGVFGIFFLPREGLEYTPYFYYGEEARESGSLFPYYVVMNGGLFLLSTDQERAMYLPDPQAAAAYRTQFEKALRWASPLFRCYHSPVLAMDDTFGGTQEEKDASVHFFHQPCLMMYLDPGIVQRALCPGYPDRERIAELAMRYYVEQPVYGQGYYNFFTKKGVAAFLRDGRMREFPESLVKPLLPEDRRMLIRRLRDSARCGGNVHCIDGRLIDVPEQVLIDVCFGRQILFSRSNPDTLRYLSISERGLVRSFLEYFRALPTMPGVSDSRESAEILDSLLKRER